MTGHWLAHAKAFVCVPVASALVVFAPVVLAPVVFAPVAFAPAAVASETAEEHPVAPAPEPPDERETDQRLMTAASREHATRRVSWRDADAAPEPMARVKLLGFNDFHGQLTARHRIGERPVGSAAVLASYLTHAARAARDGAFIVHAGDHVGASPPASALLQDEPSIAFLNLLANRHCRYADLARGPWHASHRQPRCNVVGTLGNHEFDDGVTEILRLLDGGRHPAGPFLERRWRGARFPYVAATVVDRRTGDPILPPYSIRETGGVRIAFIGALLRETAKIVTPSGVAGVAFLDEADAVNRQVATLVAEHGVKAIVLTIHEGERQSTYGVPGEGGRPEFSGVIVDIVRRLHEEVDVVISGHAHGYTNTLIANRGGRPVLVTQAFSVGTAYADVDLAIGRDSGEVREKSAVIVTTWADEGPGLEPDRRVAKLTAAAQRAVQARIARVVGVAATDIVDDENLAGESPLGNLVADAQRLRSGAQFAFMNSSGLRADLRAGDVTWGDLFAVHPFGNDLVTMDLTGAQIRTLLEQQWLLTHEVRMLQISGLSYTWNAGAPAGSRVVAIRDATGAPLGDTTVYRVAVNSFLASGGDHFPLFELGTGRVIGPLDLDATLEHIRSLPQPFTAAVEGRIVREN